MGYPELLAEALTTSTPMRWWARVFAENSRTALWVLRCLDAWLAAAPEVAIWCLLIGTNDARLDVQTPEPVFRLIYRQIVRRFSERRIPLLCGLLPPIQVGRGHLPYGRQSEELRQAFNRIIREETEGRCSVVSMEEIPASNYVDAVHLDFGGVEAVAQRFRQAILEA
jgi:lysophospholipase L1-like esterase